MVKKCTLNLQLRKILNMLFLLFKSAKAGFMGSFSFEARSTRSEFWQWVLFSTILLVFSWLLENMYSSGFLVITLMRLAILSLPTSALFTRRLHDIGKPGWWQIPMGTIGIIGLGLLTLGWMGFVFGILMFHFTIFLLIISFVGFSLVSLSVLWSLFWLAREGDYGSNEYGDDPRAI